MTKFAAFVIIVACRVVYHPSHAPSDIAPFASPSSLSPSTISIAPAKLININGSISNHKVILNWVVNENETADKFEVEKSTDGRTFTLAALVFGTDKPETDTYRFYEKAGKKKLLYRVKMINKDRQTEYSSIIEIDPNV